MTLARVRGEIDTVQQNMINVSMKMDGFNKDTLSHLAVFKTKLEELIEQSNKARADYKDHKNPESMSKLKSDIKPLSESFLAVMSQWVTRVPLDPLKTNLNVIGEMKKNFSEVINDPVVQNDKDLKAGCASIMQKLEKNYELYMQNINAVKSTYDNQGKQMQQVTAAVIDLCKAVSAIGLKQEATELSQAIKSGMAKVSGAAQIAPVSASSAPQSHFNQQARPQASAASSSSNAAAAASPARPGLNGK